ncbi:protein of unknown function [Pseudomonas flavescens]|uniref:DUF1833 domain-containing protein n=1 Tax=Phytopseudomonas flavescens TaxID=29435 RepID=A0A1G8NCJ0_9GAMM|nr:DUF1833 family protein [Pseudomonas flavescens]SDI77777.1 protein of unknown function [Pseudomonas flavescens]
MTILNRFYVSGGRDVELLTLQIDIAGDATRAIEAQRYFFVKDFEDAEARLETGETVTFQAFAMDVAIPPRNLDGTQDLKFALCNIDGTASNALQHALVARLKTSVVLRTYLWPDMAAPSQRPFRFDVKSGQWTPTQVDVTAGHRNLLDTGWPRVLYTLEKFPGLRCIA